jgi:hypothetical protein
VGPRIFRRTVPSPSLFLAKYARAPPYRPMRQRDFVDGSQDERSASCFSPGAGLGKPQAPTRLAPSY